MVEQRHELLEWMRGAAQQARALGVGAARPAPSLSRQSLLSTIDTTVREARLKEAVKRIEPDGPARVRVWLEQVEFDRLLPWLGELEQRHSVQVIDLRTDRRGPPGRVDARLTFGRGGP